jgi:hypothetical protein
VPDRLREVLAEADDGLAQRFIYAWPEPVQIGPLYESDAVDAAERRSMLHATARLLRTLEMGAGDHGQPAPRLLPLDRDALRLFDEQRQDAMRRAQAASGLAAGWHGKNPGRVLRLALVFELLSWAARSESRPEPASVSADSIARAGGYIDYAAGMLERVTGGLAVGRGEVDAAQIARRVLAIARRAPPQARLKPLNERSLYQQRGFGWARDAKRRREAFLILRDAGWVRAAEGNSQGRPRGDWNVNPGILEAAR